MATPPNRVYIGASVSGTGQTGGNDGPLVDGMGNGTGNFISDLSTYKAQGARVILKFVGAPGNYQNADLSFSLTKWKQKMDEAAAKTSAAQMAAFVNDGTLLCNNLIDDAKSGSAIFGGSPPSLAELDHMAWYSKSKWSRVPTMVRMDNLYLAQKSDWTNLDFGMCAWHRRFGNAQTWLTNNVNAGRSVGLGCIFAMNLLNGGSGLTAPWNVHPNDPNSFGMSPQEIDAVANALSSQTFSIGVNVWASNPQFDNIDYYSMPSIQTALQRMFNIAQSRVTAGPINWRDQSPSGSTDTGSGSTATVVGSWTLVDAGATKRKTNSDFVDINRPDSATEGNLQVIVCYSRDSARSFEQPDGWSTAKAISGNSGKGGQLVAFYKLGDGGESSQVVVNTPGTSDTNNSIMGRWFAFSHNTGAGQGSLLANAGSARSWTSQTGMGPVPGITSAISDSLILIIAGRANDFGGGSTDENVMSATTGPETWNRLFSTGNGLGQDGGMMVDWAATGGVASVTTKSWSQTSGSQAGAGVGFMLAFAPQQIVSGDPPAFDLGIEPDVAISVGSNLSFTIVSTGNTPITYSKQSGPSNITLGSSSGAFEFTPTAAGRYVIVLRATNSFGSDTETFAVTASSPGGSGSTQTGANSLPSISNPGNRTVFKHDLLSFIVPATDPDGNAVMYFLDPGAPEGMRIDSTTGQVTWIPAGTQAGTYTVVAGASDGIGVSRSTFTINVLDTPWTTVRGPGAGFARGSTASNSFRRTT